MPKKHLYRVVLINMGNQYEIYAKEVRQPDMYGFVEVEGLIFGEKTVVLVDPAEERLKSEFEGVKSTFIHMHAIIRIDKVEKSGKAKIVEASDNSGKIATFPMGLHIPGK